MVRRVDRWQSRVYNINIEKIKEKVKVVDIIKLFERNIAVSKYSHGFGIVEKVTKGEKVTDKIAKIISEDNGVAINLLKRGIELNKINLDLKPTNNENLYVCTFQSMEDLPEFQPYMVVYTKEEMARYLKGYIIREFEKNMFSVLKTIQELMKKKKLLKIDLDVFGLDQYSNKDVDDLKISINADSHFVMEFSFDFYGVTYSHTLISEEKGEYVINDVTAIYGVFTRAFAFHDWEEVIDPMKKWIEENQ